MSPRPIIGSPRLKVIRLFNARTKTFCFEEIEISICSLKKRIKRSEAAACLGQISRLVYEGMKADQREIKGYNNHG